MEFRIFDFEVYPNWWCVVYQNTSNDEIKVIRSDDHDASEQIAKMVYRAVIVGFNIKRYDLRILNAVHNGNDPQDIYKLSKDIVENDMEDVTHPFNNYKYWFKFSFLDLYDDWRFGSLKEFESNMGMRIVECEVPFDQEELTEDEKEEIIDYCIYDVKATRKLFEFREGYIKAKKTLSELFNIDLIQAYKSTNAKLTAIVLGGEGYKIPEESTFTLPDNLKKYTEENLPKEFLNLFSDTSLYNYETRLFDNDLVVGNGGVHSTYDTNLRSKSDDEYQICLIDVVSLYPSIMIEYNLVSRNARLKTLYKEIKGMRLFHKSERNKYEKGSEQYNYHDEVQEALKLILNTAYGAMKNKYNKLYDPFNATSICYIGQIVLTSLANKLYNNGFKILQTNTDGIIIKYKKEKQELLDTVVKEWEGVTRFEMEYDYIDQIFQKDVNNYIMVSGDYYKIKGKWSNQHNKENLANLNAPIVHTAIYDYYVKGVPIEDTILACDDVFKFCFTTKTGYTYQKTFHYVNGEPRLSNKINRVAATTNTDYGTIYKYKRICEGSFLDEEESPYLDDPIKHQNWLKNKEKRIHDFSTKTGLPFGRLDKIAEIPTNCELVNGDIDDFNDFNLDKQWYIEFANKKVKDLREV